MVTPEAIGKAMEDLKQIYPDKSAGERADMVFSHIEQYGAPPHVIAYANGNGVEKH